MLRIRDDIESLTGKALERAIAALPEWRRAAALRYKHEDGRRESAASFLLLADMLRERYGITDIEPFAVGQHGKPSLTERGDVQFNLSHCRLAVACVVSESPVGVDIECLGRYKPATARHCFSAIELRSLEETDTEAERDLLFTVLWTKKEALLKLLGCGITDNLKTVLDDYSQRVAFDVTVRREHGYVCTVAQFVG